MGGTMQLRPKRFEAATESAYLLYDSADYSELAHLLRKMPRLVQSLHKTGETLFWQTPSTLLQVPRFHGCTRSLFSCLSHL